MVCGSGDSGSSGGGIWGGGEFAQKSRYYRTYTYERSGEIFGECRGAVLSLAVPPLQFFSVLVSFDCALTNCNKKRY